MTAEREVYADTIAGTRRLRENRSKYLPKFEAESETSYKNRWQSATLLNLTKRTQQTMSGLVFKGEIELQDDVAPALKKFCENVDNEGNHIDVFARKAFEKSFEGHSLILVDYPYSDDSIRSLLDEEKSKRRPYLCLFGADQIINWQVRTNPVNKQPELSVLVLEETVTKQTGMFAFDSLKQYRVFYLDEMNRAAWQLWQEMESGKEPVMIGNGVLTGANKKALPRIPVALIYGEQTGFLESRPPLIDLAYKNIEHFQTYSDYKSLIHKTCVPIAVAKGKVDEVPILSGDIVIEVPIEGDFGFAEVSGSSLEVIRQSLEDMKQEIGLLGLSAVIDNGTNSAEVTATEALLNSIEETSHLAVMARSLKDALEQTLIHTAWYLGTDEGGSLELGTAWRKAEEMKAQAVTQNAAPIENAKAA